MTKDQQNTNIKRVQRISRNFFLHIHSTRVHPHSLKPTYTFGLGLILLSLFLIMIITGFILMMNYTPSVERAYDSVKDIVFIVPGGRYIRNMHRWAAHGMILVVFLHLIRTFLTASYLGKRRLNWIIGVCMMVVVLFMNFSGYLLPWDQLAYWAVTIGSNIAASVRELTDILGITNIFDIGGFFKRVLFGDEIIGQVTLTRFFMLHVIFLPLTLLILTGWHFWRIRKDRGISRPLEEAEAIRESVQPGTNNQEPFTAAVPGVQSTEQEINVQIDQDVRLYSWPVLMWIELTILLCVMASLLLIAFLFDAPLREEANPSFPENPAKSPWYFLGIQELVSYSAFTGGLLIPLLFIAFLISIPYIDKEEKYTGIWFSGQKGRKILLGSILLSLVVTILLVFTEVQFGWIRKWSDNISGILVMLVNPATLSCLFYVFLSVLIRKRTGSSRMAAIALFTCIITGLVIFTVMGIWFRGPDWEFYWLPSQWPTK